MRITELLQDVTIDLGVKVSSKEEAIDHLVDLMVKGGNISDREEYKKGILAREATGTTGIGGGIAIPHAKNKAVTKAGLASMTVPDGVDYEAMDGEPSDVFFMIAAPAEGSDVHLEALARLSTILMDPVFKEKLLKATTKEEYLKLIDEKETEKFPEEAEKKEEQPEKTIKDGYRVLAVTACPTGIAHTFMAAESLENKAKEMGIALKAETNGSGGAKNILTKEEIEHCDGIIVAADKNVEMARFDGKQVLQTKVADGINKPQELIQTILDGKAPTYHHSGAAQEEEQGEGESVGRQIYKHLMNGVSHMLPFVIGGGILIALAFLFDNQAINPANFGKNTPLAATLKTIGEQAFGFMLPILAGFIAMSIADRPGLAVGFVGGALANGGYTFANIMSYDSSKAISSGFIGALLAGFIGGYIIVLLRKLFDKLPSALEGLKPILLYPVCGILIMGIIMIAINPIVGAINTGLNNFLSSMSGTSSILLGAILGGMMSVDMGGPFNKAAYVFGTAQLTVANAGAEQYAIMAAVMAGGMVPPLAIALCTTFFKNRFTENERKSGVVNYVMGLSFITEGAIPFAAGDPIHILPPCIIGSAVAGALSMAFHCGLPAPHGGIFVIGVITNPLQYILSVAIGAVIGMLIMSFTKKPLKK
ncbi:PTS fructose transporter subunit IIABC [Anaerostipes sp. MSJ-23]|uniref:PTS fructose transporter subunit IIABC n=1 Tax=Anaerostipes sp. MSJ-23 TaxID=2841520 RepID=UPI001C122465|nr:PTS fructose transporter subunit IIABC [Anaerostipes sp. MSJ-23]MBU5460265.1 fructose-specific PTS transporter subunit EIIC [Anaerostipes sp. MSJ-23]